MKAKDYQNLAMRTNDGKHTERLIDSTKTETINVGEMINASFGLSGEVGELNDMIKKFVFHKHDINIADVEKELGDICWYIAMMCKAFGFNLEDVMRKNIEKLQRRYPEGFSEIKSIERTE